MSEQNTNKDGEGVKRYKWEYGNFLEFVRKKKVARAVIYAQVLNIDRRTLVHWLSQPEMRDAMVDALDELIDGMQRAGKDDWKMYRELMSIMGVKDIKGVDLTTGGEALPTVIIEGVYAREPKFRIDNSASETDELAKDSSSKPS